MEQTSHKSISIDTIQLNDQLLSERKQGINNLHKGVQEISELFQDMSMLVSAQGEQLDNIESNISSAANNTQRANSELLKANKYQRKRRKRYFCFSSIILTIILIIVLLFILKN